MSYNYTRNITEYSLPSKPSKLSGHVKIQLHNKYYDVKEDKYVKIQFPDGQYYIVESEQYKEYQFQKNGEWYLIDKDSDLLIELIK